MHNVFFLFKMSKDVKTHGERKRIQEERSIIYA